MHFDKNNSPFGPLKVLGYKLPDWEILARRRLPLTIVHLVHFEQPGGEGSRGEGSQAAFVQNLKIYTSLLINSGGFCRISLSAAISTVQAAYFA